MPHLEGMLKPGSSLSRPLALPALHRAQGGGKATALQQVGESENRRTIEFLPEGMYQDLKVNLYLLLLKVSGNGHLGLVYCIIGS
jgi:hypothetical protein